MYQSHGLNLSKNQAKKLISGESIKLPANKLVGPHSILLTKSQLNKVNKAIQSGKGCTIKLSKSQLNKNIRAGSGFLDVLKGIGKSVAPVALDFASEFLKNKIAGSGVKQHRCPRCGEGFMDVLKSVGKSVAPVAIDFASDLLKKKISGNGIRKRKRRGASITHPGY